MNTFNKPSGLDPTSTKQGEEVSPDTRKVEERPSPEKVSPSQQGKFLGALEKKEKKKEGGLFVSEGSDEEEKVEEGKGRGIFGLAATKVKGRGSLLEKGTESDEEETTDEGEHAPKPSALLQPTTTQAPQAQASIQAQAHPIVSSPAVPSPAVSSPEEEGEILSVEKYAQRQQQRIETIRSFEEQEHLPKMKEADTSKERVAFRTDIPQRAVQPPVGTPVEVHAATTEPKNIDPKVAREAIIELVNQAVDAMVTMVSQEKTTTTITMRHPPIFEGASFTITEFATAKKEFNITFNNLSPDARRLIEATNNEQHLRQALIDKGYTIHTITIEPLIPKAATQFIETSSSQQQGEQGRRFEDTSSQDRPRDEEG